ncbi:MAG: SDR family NAD(P)-dependent oxidoreductase [SAR324 cluster bacterium]|nr:SDR family NAD(P)-dependent oxidoreductase [SAR324 cluster bacterium]
MIKSLLITGANGGLGKDSARQMALLETTEKIYLGCRNEEKAKAAQADLEEITGRKIFEILIIDVSNLDSVRAAVKALPEPVEALVMNAGGMGGKSFSSLTKYGVTEQFSTNVLGHALLLDEIIAAKKLTKVAIYAGSEAARGVVKMNLKRPKLKESSVADFISICDGTHGPKTNDPLVPYGPVKYVAAHWMASMARKHPELRIVTVSPGSTSGTDVGGDLAPFMKFAFTVVGPKLLPLFGLMHEVEKGAKRYVDVLTDESYKSGVFYASKASTLTGKIVDQGDIFSDLNNESYQDNAYEAVHSFLK